MQKTIRIVPEGRAAARAPLDGGTTTLLSSLPPLSVYVHVPWCMHKCPYCDFNSHALKGDVPESQYLEALAADLEQALPLVWGRTVISVFIGGGTPSLLSANAVDNLLALLRSYLPVLPDAEITLEANPGTVEAARFKAYAASGVNRISLGIQSFDDASLRALGRIHDGAQARAAIEAAQRAVERVNLDVMTGLPNQDLAGLRRDLAMATSFACEHLSFYDLTLEPNTVFAKYPPVGLPDDDTAAEMQDVVADALATAGYNHYEVSAYAQSRGECVHNKNYWEFGDYLGIGPGAHGKLSFHDKIIRQAKLRNPESWMAHAVRRDGSHLAEDRQVGASELPFEFMLNVLRLREGVPTAWFTERTGQALATISPALAKAAQQGLLTSDPSRIAPTARGWRFLNDLQQMFL